MKEHDSFEEMLRRQRVKAAPESWRAGILATAHSAMEGKASNRRVTPIQRRFGVASELLSHIASEFFSPGRKAWGALASTWAVIVLLALANRDKDAVPITPSNSISPVARELLREQARLLTEFSGSDESTDAVEPRRPEARPHSQREAAWTRA